MIMGKLTTIFKDTAIYGLSSIIGRFLNYLLVPLYTAQLSAASGGYGIITNIYAYVALAMVLLTFGMETTYFRFTNKTHTDSQTVYGTTLITVGSVSLVFAVLVLLLLSPVSQLMGYGDHPEYVGVMAITVAIDAFLCIPFAHLRQQKKALKFAALKLLNIAVSILLNLIYFYFMDGKDVGYAFYINLVCTVMLAVCLITEYTGFRWKLDTKLLKNMLSYSWPILVLGVAGILNQTADKMLFPYIYEGSDGMKQLGIYGACSKIAMIMAMITQAFRFAYEPIVFAGVKDKDQHEMYEKAMKFFIIFTLLAFLIVVAYMDILKVLIIRNPDYWVGLEVVPIVMAAEIMMGIYFNLSFWYKIIVLWYRLCRAAGCQHHLCAQVRLYGLCLGRICRIWSRYARQLFRGAEILSPQLSAEGNSPLCGISFRTFWPDAFHQRLADDSFVSFQYPARCGLYGRHHLARPAPCESPRRGQIL